MVITRFAPLARLELNYDQDLCRIPGISKYLNIVSALGHSGDRSISTAPDYDGPPATTLTLRDVLRSSLMYRFAATIPKTM